MNIFPLNDAVKRAFECMYWEDAGNERYYKAFASHWGGLELEHMRRAFENGEGEEKVMAIFALGLTAAPENADLLAPLLYQAPRMERWASAICLGLMKDERAFPILENLLLDGLEQVEYIRLYKEVHRKDRDLFQTQIHAHYWYGAFRWHAIQLLEGWDSPSLLSTLKQTFAALWGIQRRLRPFKWFELPSYDALAYELGQRGDFTLLQDLKLPRAYRNVARVHMALGHLRAQVSSGSELTGLTSQISGLGLEMLINDTLQQRVAAELGVQFGLSHTEQEESLDRLYDDDRSRETYGRLDVKKVRKRLSTLFSRR